MTHTSQMSRTSIKKFLLPVSLVVVLVILPVILMRFNGLWPDAAPAAVSDSKPTVSGSDAEVVLACSGRVEGLTEVIEVGAGIEGVLAEVRAREGQPVIAGDILALIGCDDLKAELQSARRLAEAARQSRRRLLRGSREEERRMAAAEVQAAQAVFNQAQLQRRRITGLFERGDVSKEAMEKSRRDMEVAEASLRAKTEFQELISAPPLPEELAKADAEVQAEDERIRVASAKLEKCVIRAPINGTVLRRHLNVGESVSALIPRPIVSLADIARLRVRAEVDERDLGRIFTGQTVIVLADAFPNKKLRGRVSWIGPMMGRKKAQTGDPAEKSDRDVLEVLADLEENDDRVVVGLRTTVRFIGSRNPGN